MKIEDKSKLEIHKLKKTKKLTKKSAAAIVDKKIKNL